jgi:G:T/U-mismatch repair DNA glycosylase
MSDQPPSAVSEAPPVTLVDAVGEIVDGRLAFYRRVSLAATIAAAAAVIIVIITSRAAEWVPSTLKLAGAASAVFGGVFPVAAYFKWKGLSILCKNYRQLVLDYQAEPAKIGINAFARASNSFWRLYETTWEQ